MVAEESPDSLPLTTKNRPSNMHCSSTRALSARSFSSCFSWVHGWLHNSKNLLNLFKGAKKFKNQSCFEINWRKNCACFGKNRQHLKLFLRTKYNFKSQFCNKNKKNQLAARTPPGSDVLAPVPLAVSTDSAPDPSNLDPKIKIQKLWVFFADHLKVLPGVARLLHAHHIAVCHPGTRTSLRAFSIGFGPR